MEVKSASTESWCDQFCGERLMSVYIQYQAQSTHKDSERSVENCATIMPNNVLFARLPSVKTGS